VGAKLTKAPPWRRDWVDLLLSRVPEFEKHCLKLKNKSMALGNLLAALKIAPSAAGYKNKQILRYYAIGESHGVSMTVTFHASLTMDRMQNLKKNTNKSNIVINNFYFISAYSIGGEAFQIQRRISGQKSQRTVPFQMRRYVLS